MITTLFRYIIYCNAFCFFLYNIFFVYYYNKQIPECIQIFLYYLIRYYSKLEIYTRKINVKITNYIKTKPFICNLIDKYIKLKSFQKYEYVKDGNVIAISDLNNKIENLDYDFIVFEDNDGFTTNNIILNDISDNNLNYEESKWSFINISVKLINDNNNDYEIPILLKSFDYNFLITNNKINQKFMKYFLKKYYNNYFIKTNTDLLYSIQLIDSNAEIINFNYLKTLVIYKDNYLLENNTIEINSNEINNN